MENLTAALPRLSFMSDFANRGRAECELETEQQPRCVFARMPPPEREPVGAWNPVAVCAMAQNERVKIDKPVLRRAALC